MAPLFGKNPTELYLTLTLDFIYYPLNGWRDQFDPPPPSCGVSKNVSPKERERVKSWIFVTYNTYFKVSECGFAK